MRLKKKKANTNSFKVTVIALDEFKAKSIKISGWSSLKDKLELSQIEKEIQKLRYNTRQLLYRFTTNHSQLKNQFIVDLSNVAEGYFRNDRTYLELDVTLFGTPTDNDVRMLISSIDSLLNNSEIFQFKISKK